MPAAYKFSLDNFTIRNTMAAGTDTDFVYLTLKVGDKVFGPVYAKVGDLNNGTYPLDWSIPASVNPVDPVLMTYQFVNNGHGSQQEQIQNSVRIAQTIASAVGTIVGIVFPPTVLIVGEILTALKKAGDIATWITGQINCDGMVLSDAVVVDGNRLAQLTAASGSYTEVRSYTGPDTPIGCGSNAQYDVEWTISRWSGWSEVGGGGVTNRSLAATVFNNRLYIFGVSTAGLEFVNSSADGVAWSGWSEVGGGGTTDRALAAVVFNDRIFLFGVSLQGGEFVNSSVDGVAWSGWSEVGGGGTTNLPLSATVFNGRLYIFGVSAFSLGNSGKEFVNSSADGVAWSGWSEVGGGGTTFVSLNATVANGRIYLFGVSILGREFVNSSADGVTWAGWHQIGGGGITRLALAATVLGNKLCLFGVSNAGKEFVNTLSV